jgi:hypothetical protein
MWHLSCPGVLLPRNNRSAVRVGSLRPNRFIIVIAVLALAASVLAQQATVDITPGHSTNSFSPLRALGAGVDRDALNSVKGIFSLGEVQQMFTAGWGGLSYRLNTERAVQAWHWRNPIGAGSHPAGQGYFVGAANSHEGGGAVIFESG